MKNPFKKEPKATFITAIVLGGVTAAALAYLFLTEDGEALLNVWKHRATNAAKEVASGAVSRKAGISKKMVRKVADMAV